MLAIHIRHSPSCRQSAYMMGIRGVQKEPKLDSELAQLIFPLNKVI